MATLEILLLLLVLCVGLAALAQRLNLPIAVPLVLGGMALALIPGLPAVELEPELALALFLPPLLQISAYRTDWPQFRSNLRPILLLAIGAVFFTAGVVAVVARAVVPGLPWWAAVALGAIIAPPDAVAAGSVLKRFNLPKRMVVILEGESLINDASALVLYRFAVGAVAAGTVSYLQGAFQFVAMAAAGAIVGWLTGRLAMWIFTKIDDTLLDIAVGLLAGFGAYFAAEAVHGSGVLGAVTCGLLLGQRQHAEFSARTRLELNAVLNFVEFVLASLVFMLIGLQLREVVGRLTEYHWERLALIATTVSVTLILSRFVWIFISAWVPRRLSRRLREADPMPTWQNQFVLSWAGMRGVVSLAAALALPAKFPGRDIILFLAFCSILATLIVQGTTLGWLVVKLGVVEPDDKMPVQEETQARAEIAGAALGAVQQHLDEQGGTEHAEAAGKLVDEYQNRADRLNANVEDAEKATPETRESELQLRLIAIDAARKKLDEHTDQVETDTHRSLGEELDLEEQRIRSSLGKG